MIGSGGISWDPSVFGLRISTFITAGLALIGLGISYFFIDVRGSKKCIQPSLVFGMNAITVYVLAGVVARLLYVITIAAADEIL